MTDHKQLASELLDMSYGDLMSLGYALSAILNGEVSPTSGPIIAQGLYDWAKKENERGKGQTND